MSLLIETINKISDLDKLAMTESKKHVDSLIKPIGSLGRMEEFVVQLAGITGNIHPKVDKRAVIVMASDHGVCEEGVVAAPQDVTLLQAINMTRHKTGVCAFSKALDADVVVVDIGIKCDVQNDNIINRKISYGTKNMAKLPAMTREEAIKALEVGIEMANMQIDKGINIIATGEMGIGNTTPSSAILSVVTGLDPEEVTGIGANLDVNKVKHKADVIRKAIELHNPNKNDAIDILSKVGGFDIAGMAGTILGCAANKTPVIVDGYISTVAALIASMIQPKVKGYLIPSHSSNEKAAKLASALVDLKPVLDLNMRLGEGSGAVLMFALLQAAVDMNDNMLTFEESGIAEV